VVARARPCPPVPPLNLHGKEGVSGSSPEEGLKYLQISFFCCLVWRSAGEKYGGGHRAAVLQAFQCVSGAHALPKGTLREHGRGGITRGIARQPELFTVARARRTILTNRAVPRLGLSANHGIGSSWIVVRRRGERYGRSSVPAVPRELHRPPSTRLQSSAR
jgi:hypothetical protein